jgi:hypothetical protein
VLLLPLLSVCLQISSFSAICGGDLPSLPSSNDRLAHGGIILGGASNLYVLVFRFLLARPWRVLKPSWQTMLRPLVLRESAVAWPDLVVSGSSGGSAGNCALLRAFTTSSRRFGICGPVACTVAGTYCDCCRGCCCPLPPSDCRCLFTSSVLLRCRRQRRACAPAMAVLVGG